MKREQEFEWHMRFSEAPKLRQQGYINPNGDYNYCCKRLKWFRANGFKKARKLKAIENSIGADEWIIYLPQARQKLMKLFWDNMIKYERKHRILTNAYANLSKEIFKK